LTEDQLVEASPCKNPAWTGIWKEALALVKHDASTLQDLYKIEGYLNAPVYDGGAVGQPLNPEFENVGRWFAATGARPSAKA
jgi:hypothetical protein